MRCLLDACSFLWLCSDPARLSRRARVALSSPTSEILLSDVSVLEISLKWLSGKIVLPAPPRSWIEDQAEIWHLNRVPLSSRGIYRSVELPDLHRDPFDRLLVATALEEDATVVSPDEWIRRYPVPTLW